VHGTENIVDLTHELLALGVDGTSQKGNFVWFNESDDVAFASVRESSNFNDSSGGSLVETTTTEAATTASEATSVASTEATSGATSVASTETTSIATTESTASSNFKAHFTSMF
jgi:hypothetical protein